MPSGDSKRSTLRTSRASNLGAMRAKRIAESLHAVEITLTRASVQIDTRRAALLRHVRQTAESFGLAFERMPSGTMDPEECARTQQEFYAFVAFAMVVLGKKEEDA